MSDPVSHTTFDGPLAEALSQEPPTAELDGGPTLGWYGLYRNQELPGGAILHRDDDGFVTSWYSPSTDRLNRCWAEIRDAYVAMTGAPPA
jgi:hypothetical protein